MPDRRLTVWISVIGLAVASREAFSQTGGPSSRPAADGARSIEDARAGVAKGNAAYIAAFARSDALALANVYAPDGARLGEHGQLSKGRKAIAAEVQGLVTKVGPVTVVLETVDLWVTGSTAYETGKWSYRFQPKGQNETRIGGRYVTVWSRQPSGEWLIQADMGVPGT